MVAEIEWVEAVLRLEGAGPRQRQRRLYIHSTDSAFCLQSKTRQRNPDQGLPLTALRATGGHGLQQGIQVAAQPIAVGGGLGGLS